MLPNRSRGERWVRFECPWCDDPLWAIVDARGRIRWYGEWSYSRLGPVHNACGGQYVSWCDREHHVRSGVSWEQGNALTS